METTRFAAFAISAALAALTACHGGPGRDDGDRVVYVAGTLTDAQGESAATLWEDGAPRKLGQRFSEAFSVYAFGDDVYVAGCELGPGGDILRPVLWINGAPHYLPHESPFWAVVGSVHVSGDKLCVAGYEIDDDWRYVAKVWVNGRGQSLGGGQAMSVFASGGDVYVAGYDMPSEQVASTLWKNGAPQTLAPTVHGADAFAESVFVSGGDVYVAGAEVALGPTARTVHAVLWENGIAHRIGGPGESEARSVFVSGGVVYVSGLEVDAHGAYAATVWKNGSAMRQGGARSATALSVFVRPNGDVYAAGAEFGAQDETRPRLWKNGAAQALGGGADDSVAWSVFVADRLKH